MRLLRFGFRFAVVVLPVAFALFVLMEHVRGQRALAKGIAVLQAKGEKLTINELMPPRPPEDQNGAPTFLAATGRLNRNAESVRWAPSGWKFVAPGRAWPFLKTDGWLMPRPLARSRSADDKQGPEWIKTQDLASLLGRGGKPWVDKATMQDLALELQEARSDLDQVRESLRKPALDFGSPYSVKQFRGLHLAKTKLAALWLKAAALSSLQQADPEGALANLEALAALAHKQMQERLLISQLVGIGIAHGGFPPTWEALQSPGWADEQLARLQAAWTGRSYVEEMVPVLAIERAVGREYFDSPSASTLELLVNRDLTITFPSSRWEEFLEKLRKHLDAAREEMARIARRRYYFPLWRAAWADQDHLRLLERWQTYLDATRQLVVHHSWQRVKTTLPEQTGEEISSATETPPRSLYDGWRFWVSGQVSKGVGQCIFRAVQAETLRTMTVTAIALKRYQLRHGRLPANLSSLVGEFLHALPIDDMDGQPLRYRLNPDGSFTLYSVGEDEVDDGGNPEPPESKHGSRNILKGRDLVWPVPATAAEVAAEEAGGKGKRPPR